MINGVEFIDKGPASKHNTSSVYDIVYNGAVYGEWNDEANTDYPEDLTIHRDLQYLIEVGIKIGKQMQINSEKS